MKLTAERIDNHKVVLEMEVPQVEVAKALEKAYTRLANKVNIPGFRKGKAPRNILEMRLGKQALLDEAFDILAPTAYNKALADENIEPVGRPEIEVIKLEENHPLVFKATVVAKPEIELGQYKGLKVEKAAVEVTEDQIKAQLDGLLDHNAKMVVVEDAVLANGDFAVIDFEGFIDGVPFSGGEGKGYPLQLGSASFIPGFEEQLLGAKAGEEREVSVSFPEDYHVKELAGKAAVFKVKIHDVKRKELPELDDDFAKDVSEFDTVEELKADIKNKLEQTAQEKTERDFRAAVVKQAVENSTVDIPEIMIEQRIDHMLNELDISLQNRGMNLENYMQYAKMDISALRQSYRDAALLNVKTDLMLEAVGKTEAVEVKPEDMEAEVVAMAQTYGASPEQVSKIIREQGRIGDLAASIIRKKAAQLIIDSVAAE
ncbi:trigger factor|uniref:Trigger factor n=1 Tax=Dendrosporobacter quercicolus TaxID=146817 RepID=A0A1G9N6R2_9FIRM|nr:trigger factor [Dendrosporobacter quercicolus]NSL47248.1 trigger factor [Dendrosporobacter quercicolus DSM 1736]SDL82168.1 trigger factor [Dendrosporobacter quercicolus]